MPNDDDRAEFPHLAAAAYRADLAAHREVEVIESQLRADVEQAREDMHRATQRYTEARNALRVFVHRGRV